MTHYSLKLDYEPQNEQLDGDVTITARATQDLSSFNLDLRGFKVEQRDGERRAGRVHAQGPGADDHAGRAGSAATATSPSRVVYAGHVNYVLDPDHVEGRLDPDRRRRVRGERAAGRADAGSR